MPKKIKELNTPTLPLTGGELFEASQDNISVKVPLDEIRNYDPNGIFTGSSTVGMGVENGTNLLIDYGNGLMIFEIAGQERLYQNDNIFMIGISQGDIDPPYASGGYLRLETGRDGVTNFDQFNVTLAGTGMLQMIAYNFLTEVTFFNSDKKGALNIHGSQSFGGTPNSLTYQSGGIGNEYTVFDVSKKSQVLGPTSGAHIDIDQVNEIITLDGILKLKERSVDPPEPSEGETVIWMSDGTQKGNDGDVMIASQAGGVTRYSTLFVHASGSVW